jgi:molybdenum cofactor guanylyltransferase
VTVDAAGVVLVGGLSSRMGTSKAALEWHGGTLLYRTAALLRRTVAGPVVVVRAAGQELPALPAGVEVAEDARPGRGPMQGILTGLEAVGPRRDTAFVCSTDLPFLHPAFVRAVLAGLADPAVDLVLPVARGHPQPLAAGYRVRAARRVPADGRIRPRDLPEHLAALRPDERALLADPGLAAADPGLESLRNVNTPGDYAAARAEPPPRVRVRGVAARAATLADAGLAGGPVTLNGVLLADPDPLLPLVTGDELT